VRTPRLPSERWVILCHKGPATAIRPRLEDVIAGPDETVQAPCGPGLYVEELVRHGAHVIGFDQSPALIELARQRVDSAADLRVHDLTQPLSWVGDASIDLVVCALALKLCRRPGHHAPQVPAGAGC
jgi:trans-aconitate methyltransferase